MLKVALTGGIATGKSHVLEQFRLRGVPCLDADQLAHGATVPGSEAAAAIAERFGPEILEASGALDRRALGRIVFADATARRDLEAIVHPAVRRAIAVGLRAFELVDRSPLAIVDIPLLFETGRASDFDKVIATACTAEHQLARLRDRGLSHDEAVQRIAAQMPLEEKARRADHVIRTDGTFDDTARQVEQVLEALRSDASLRK